MPVKQPDDYIPKRVGPDCYLIKIKVLVCRKCGVALLPSTFPEDAYWGFPHLQPTIVSQLKRAGVHLQSAVGTVEGGPICSKCVEENPIYKCYLCGERRKKDELQVSYGYPADHLCKYCYDTVSAKLWDATVKDLEEDHRHDWD